MLKKFLSIKNVGKFRDYSAAGDTELARLSLVLADNGRGKTTAGDIFRSLKSGNPANILGRATLGAAGKPEVTLRFDVGNITFKNAAWSQSYPDICIYDTAFVHENVFAGDCVGHNHKKNLYTVIVGEEGVKLARTVEETDSKIKEAHRDMTAKKMEVERHLPDGMSLQTFLAVGKDDSVDAKIAEKEQEMRAIQSAEQIKAKGLLKNISLPEIPEKFSAVMRKTLPDVTSEVETTVRNHLKEHTNGATEHWLAEGIGSLKDEACPFCNQSTRGNDLVAAYSAFFGRSYGELKREIDEQQAAVDTAFGRRGLSELQRTVASNADLIAFWKAFVTFVEPELSFEHEVAEPFEHFHDAAAKLVEKKRNAPLDAIEQGSDFLTALGAFERSRSIVTHYNNAIAAANSAIMAKKAANANIDPVKTKAAMLALHAAKKRHEASVDTKCMAYQLAVVTKEKLEREKVEAKAALDAYSEKVFDKYQGEINDLLTKFGAAFRLTDAKRSYAGGTPSSTYQLVINGHCVDLGDEETPASKPSFRNTLSSGDKNTLALAFFLAQIERDPRKGEKIVVFDDPFTSQDKFRRTCTYQLINRLAGIVKQVIVFSHDASFLKSLWDNAGPIPAKVLQIARAGVDNVTINICDIEAETKSVYLLNHAKMLAFSREGKGELSDVVKCIRPFLEGWLRLRYPGNFSETEWLGDFIKKIREADPTSPLYAAQGMLSELTAINDYSKKYHHEQTPGSDAEPINDTELLTFVNRTLALVGN